MVVPNAEADGLSADDARGVLGDRPQHFFVRFRRSEIRQAVNRFRLKHPQGCLFDDLPVGKCPLLRERLTQELAQAFLVLDLTQPSPYRIIDGADGVRIVFGDSGPPPPGLA